MKVMYLKRLPEMDCGTPGVLYDETVPFALTIERKWFNNKIGESCIPVGERVAKRVKSPKFGDTFEVETEGRTAILFHKGNIDDDSHGCIIVGENFIVWRDGSVGVGASGDGFGEFLNRLKNHNEFKLVITNLK